MHVADKVLFLAVVANLGIACASTRGNSQRDRDDDNLDEVGTLPDAGPFSKPIDNDTSPAKPKDAGDDPGAKPDASLAACGNGILDPASGEVCDDGNKVSGDGCSADCRTAECDLPNSYKDPTTQFCYWRETDVVSRTSAIAACARRKGKLVTWKTAAVRDAAYGPTVGGLKGRVWIGAKKKGAGWVWDDGSPAPEMNFRSGEPSGDGECVEWGPANSLNDVPCDVTRDYVCERLPAGSKG